MRVVILARILVAILIAIVLYNLFDIFREIKRQDYLGNALGELNGKYKDRKKRREVLQLIEGEKEEKTLIEKIDLLIEHSCIRIYFPFLTSEVFIVSTTAIALIVSILFYKITHIAVVSIPVFFMIILLIYIGLNLLARRTYDKIDDQVLVYINILENLTSSNSDIVEIMEKALPYINEPLKKYTYQFVFECRKGVPVAKAFKNFENKVESLRFKQLLKNLAVCSKYEANYIEILSKSRVIMKNYFLEKARRKKEIRESRITIITTVVIGLFAIKEVIGFCPSLKDQLINSALGNMLVAYNAFVIMLAIYKFITLDKLNY